MIKADSIAITITIDFARISILSRNRVRTNHVRCVFALDFVLWCRTIENLHSKRVCCYIDFFDFCPGRARSAINDFAANQRSWKKHTKSSHSLRFYPLRLKVEIVIFKSISGVSTCWYSPHSIWINCHRSWMFSFSMLSAPSSTSFT